MISSSLNSLIPQVSITASLSKPKLTTHHHPHDHDHHHHLRTRNDSQHMRRGKIGICKAHELVQDAPFAAAIGACMLSSLVLPASSKPDEDGDGSVSVTTDARLAVMGIISFIPYFNWLSWVFAWLDTGKRRYAVYSFVYLIPYLRSNLSISPEESWLPIASIIFCIVHIQLEASIRNGDIQGIPSFGIFNPKKKLPLDHEKSKDEIRHRGVPKKPNKDREHMNNDWEDK